MAADADGADSSFPHWVAWGSLCLALLLFFGNTVPAVRERAALRSASTELRQLRRSYDEALQQARTATPAGNTQDLQSLLLAIDAIGWTPEELLRHYPEPGAPPAPRAAGGGTSRPATADAPPRADAPVRGIDPPMGGDLPVRR